MRHLTLPLALAASLIAGTSAFAASSTMSNDAASSGTMSGNSMSSDTMSGHTAPGTMSTKHMASTKTSTHVMTGKIKSVDTASNMLVLTNGKKFMLPADFMSASVKKGEKVKVSYRMDGKNRAATAVSAAR